MGVREVIQESTGFSPIIWLSQRKMERLLNKQAVSRKFEVGDQVLALLPVNNPFQASFAGPYPVLKCLPGQNDLLKTENNVRGYRFAI